MKKMHLPDCQHSPKMRYFQPRTKSDEKKAIFRRFEIDILSLWVSAPPPDFLMEKTA